MLESIRKHSNSIFVKAFLFILAFGFVLCFGFYDIVRKISGKDYVVKIGNVKISPQEFKLEKARKLSVLNALGKTDIDDEAVRVEILHQMIWKTIINLAAQDYGLIVSDDTLKRYINGMDIFKNKDGSFNANALRGFLHKIQMSESAFLEHAEREICIALVKAPMNYISPMRELDDHIAIKNEKRSVKFIRIKFSSMKVEEYPTKEDLEEFYNKNSDQFMVDEVRSFKILKIDESELANNIIVSKEEIREAYDFSTEKDSRSFEEMREELEADLRRNKLLTVTNEFTRKVEDELMISEDADTVAKQFNLQIIEVPNICTDGSGEGMSALEALPYKNEVITIAFSLDEGADSSFSESLNEKKETVLWLVHIEKITPKHKAQFKQVEQKVEKAWKQAYIRDTARNLAQKITEEINNGLSLDEIARKYGYKCEITELFNRDGEAIETKSNSNRKIIESIKDYIFFLDKKESAYMEIGDEFIIYQVDKICAIDSSDKNREIYIQDNEKKDFIITTVEDKFQELIGYLANKYGVSINYDMLKEINEEIDQKKVDLLR